MLRFEKLVGVRSYNLNGMFVNKARFAPDQFYIVAVHVLPNYLELILYDLAASIDKVFKRDLLLLLAVFVVKTALRDPG